MGNPDETPHDETPQADDEPGGAGRGSARRDSAGMIPATDQTGSDIIEQHAQQLTEQTPAGPPNQTSEPTPTAPREYRAAELAEAAGITPRTLRFYRERKLLDPPRKDGRIAWYDEHHLARLHTIAGLLARGHTLGGIADLLVAFEKGKDSESAAELLGLQPELAPRFSEETPVHLTPEDLAARFPDEDTPENLSAAIDLGYLRVEGDEIVHISQRLLDASTALVGQGVPLAAVLAAGQEVRRHVESISLAFAELLRTHLPPSAHERREAHDVLDLLRPFATQVVEAELTMALDRRMRHELEEWFRDRSPHAPKKPPSAESRPKDDPEEES